MHPTLSPFDEHNRRLQANVHPPDWVNPTPDGRYNLAIVGAGTAGLVMAAGAAGLGAKVALVERELMGGDCLNVGCVPSKALLRAARAVADVKDAGRFGVRIEGEVHADFPDAMARMRALRADISPHDSARRFRDLGVDVYLGTARFTGPDRLEVDGRTILFRRAAIATGARPSLPGIPGLADAGALTNETVFSLTALPRRLAVIGGGPIGCELAQAFARFGAEVTLLAGGRGLLARDEREAAALVAQALRRDGVEILDDARAVRVDREGESRVVAIQGGPSPALRVDAVLVAAGRTPNVEQLGLEAAGVAYDTRAGVRVDDRLRTTNPAIYAAGDVCSAAKFTHLSDAHARIVLRNALFFGRARASALIVPHCTYTDPEVAGVGVTTEAAARRGLEIQTHRIGLEAVDRAVLDGETEGFALVHVARKGGRIMGATIVARHAGDLIAEVTAVMRAGGGIGELADTIHAYPTQAEVIRKAADAWNRTRLTPFVKQLLGRLLAWQR